MPYEEEPLVSVIIPVYNAAPYLPRCLDAVLAQTWRRLEVICVEDGSRDGSPAILMEYAQRDPRVRCIFQEENRGQSAARNLGLDAAAGEWITFVDSDDAVTPDMVACLFRAARNGGVQLAKGGMVLCRTDEGTEERIRKPPRVLRGEDLMRYVLKEDSYRAPFPCLIHSSLFSGLRFQEGRIFEDTCLFMELLLRTDGCAYTGELLYIYYLRPDGTVKGSSIEKKMDRIWASQEVTRCVVQALPSLEGWAHACELEIACPLLYELDSAGREKYPQQWQYAVDTIAALRRKKMEKRFYHRAVLLLFSISPVLLVKTRKVYMWLMERIRKICGTR